MLRCQGTWKNIVDEPSFNPAGLKSVTACDADKHCRKVLDSLHQDSGDWGSIASIIHHQKKTSHMTHGHTFDNNTSPTSTHTHTRTSCFSHTFSLQEFRPSHIMGQLEERISESAWADCIAIRKAALQTLEEELERSGSPGT